MSEKKPSRKSILSSIGSKKQHQKQEAAAAAQAAQAAQSAGPTAAQKNESLNNSNGDHGASNGASDAARYRVSRQSSLAPGNRSGGGVSTGTGRRIGVSGRADASGGGGGGGGRGGGGEVASESPTMSNAASASRSNSPLAQQRYRAHSGASSGMLSSGRASVRSSVRFDCNDDDAAALVAGASSSRSRHASLGARSALSIGSTGYAAAAIAEAEREESAKFYADKARKKRTSVLWQKDDDDAGLHRGDTVRRTTFNKPRGSAAAAAAAAVSPNATLVGGADRVRSFPALPRFGDDVEKGASRGQPADLGQSHKDNEDAQELADAQVEQRVRSDEKLVGTDAREAPADKTQEDTSARVRADSRNAEQRPTSPARESIEQSLPGGFNFFGMFGKGDDTPEQSDDVLKGDNNKAAQDDEHDPDVPDDADANAALQEAEEDYGAPLGPSKDAAALIEEEERANAAAKKSSTPAHKRGSKRADKVDLLTPVQRHYLLKALVSTEMQLEWSELEKLGALTQYGYPFSPTRPKLKRVQKDLDMDSEFAKGEFAAAADDPYADEDQARRAENIAEPLMLRHMFQVFLKPFPGLKEAPLKYWQKRIQPYFDETAARNFSHSTERAELTSRRFYTLAFTRYLGGFMARGFGVRGEGETKGPGKGESGSERWGVGKQWGKGTVKRGLDKPIRIDDALMDKIDSLFSGPEGDVWRRARKETHRVRRDWQAFKEHTIESEAGLEETMAYLQVSNIRNLPPRYRNAEEWARMHAAYLFHNLFVTSPAADSIFGVVKGIHALFPYWGARQLLKVANAESMISGILGLLLARPAGAKSLVQRVFTYVLGKEATAFQKDYIVPFRKEINDIELTKKIEEYVKRASRPEGRAIRSRAERTGADVLTTILLHSSGTQLSSQKQSYVQQLEKSYAKSPYAADVNLAYPPKTPAGKALEGRAAGNWGVSSQEADEARTFALLKLHLRVCLKKRDREQAILFASGSLIPTIIKDSLQQVFFPAIRSIASAVDLSERLHDLQNFIDDLIKIKKKGDDQLVAFIALAARHEQSLYLLFSQMHTIIDPFAAWLQTGADYMAMSTTDPLNPANRKAKNLEVNLEELLRDDRLTQEDAANIVKEVDELAQFVKWQKVWYELEMRKNFILARPEAAPASGLNADDIPKGSMRQEIEDVDALLKELMKAEGVPIEQGDVRTLARGTEKADFPWAWFDKLDPLGQHIVSSSGEVEPDLSFKPRGTTAPIPEMLTLRKLMPAFQDLLRETLPRWQDGDERGPPRDAGLLAPPRAGTTAGASTPANTAPPSVAGDGKSTTKSKGGFGSMFRKK